MLLSKSLKQIRRKNIFRKMKTKNSKKNVIFNQILTYQVKMKKKKKLRKISRTKKVKVRMST